MDARASPQLKRIYNRAALMVPDGMSMVWLGRLAGHREVGRVYGPDLMRAVCDRLRRSGCRHFFLGGRPEVAARLVAALGNELPGLEIAGTHSPPFRPLSPDEQSQLIERINHARPDIVWVGLGTPLQDHWMDANYSLLDVPLLVGVGAAFDFLAGAKHQAPRWVQRLGLEWFFRLATEPRRLWPRYSRYPRFVLLVLAERLSRMGRRHG